MAVATEGRGVVESFLALLYCTWRSLEKEHQLSQKFDFDGLKFMRTVAEKLNFSGTIDDFLGAAVGGELAHDSFPLEPKHD